VDSYYQNRDKKLQERKLVRGKAAFSRFPRMTQQQYDVLFKNREVLFDDRGDTLKHRFVDYFDRERLARMMGIAIAGGRGQPGEPAELKEMDRILTQSHSRDVPTLVHWLDNPHLSAKMYALWCLEGILCGGSQHFADETLDDIRLLLRNTPKVVRKIRKDSPCVSIRRGYWPTETELTRAGAPIWAKDNN
jgi:hypothetical protein